MGTKFSGSNAAPEKSSPEKSSPEKKLSIFVSKISPATGVKRQTKTYAYFFVSALRRSQDQFLRQKIERFF